MNRVLMLVMAALVCATSAMAAEPTGTLKKIKDRKTIVLGYRESSWPFSFVDADGQPAGYSVDLCVRIAEAVQQQLALPKLAVRWIKLTPENRITAVADGSVDMGCGSTTSTLSRQQQVDFTITTFVDGGACSPPTPPASRASRTSRASGSASSSGRPRKARWPRPCVST